ncbi:MAG: 50S ribosome-binding GTPase [Nanoarchaeota archaeon]|nr:50S ribosome-binding GTPase [Nanoarchaeota archaeon]
MKDPEEIVDNVIRHADIVLIVLDARRVAESTNRLVETKVKRFGKRFLYVINKCDLVEKNKQIRIPNSVRISAKNRLGTLSLLRRIRTLSGKKDVVVGVVGFPNTGKSTLINILKGKKSAPTSPVAGYTKGLQKIRISHDIMMIDTPGVLPYSRKRPSDVVIGAIDTDKILDPEAAVAELIESLDGRIEEYFGVEKKEDKFETLDEIALKKNIIKKKGEPDSKRMAKEIIRLVQTGKIPI